MTQVKGIIDRNRIVLVFGYDPEVIRKVRTIPGCTFRKVSRNFAVPLDMQTGRMLRKLFGQDFVPSAELLAWGRDERAKQRNLSSFSMADDYPLEELRVYKERPDLAATLWPHQRADTKFMASTSCINANEQGTGKTRVVASATYEAAMEDRPHLVVTHMVTPIEATWAAELEQWVDAPILAHEDTPLRKKDVAQAIKWYDAGEPFWLVINKELVRYVAEYDEYYDENTGKWKRKEVRVYPLFDELFQILWGTVSVDEFHEQGLSNIKTLGARAFAALKTERKFALSGTPMQGKPRRLWGALHWIDPKTFSSEWNWINQWLEVEEHPIFKTKTVGGLKPERREEFYQHLAPYMVRRLKSEVFPDLPPKQYEYVACKMTPGQRKQYHTFAKEAELRIDEYHLTSKGVLDEYARLRILATAKCTAEGRVVYDRATREEVERIKLIATEDSGKFPRLLEKLREFGVEPGEQELGALVSSTSRSVVEACASYLQKHDYEVAVLKGGMKENVRGIVQKFQAGGPGPNVIIMVDRKGGTSLTMDRADSVHILDEGWVPDVTEQVEDRAHRGSRIHRVTVCKYISDDSIDWYIREVGDTKTFLNHDILDLRQKGFRAI